MYIRDTRADTFNIIIIIFSLDVLKHVSLCTKRKKNERKKEEKKRSMAWHKVGGCDGEAIHVSDICSLQSVYRFCVQWTKFWCLRLRHFIHNFIYCILFDSRIICSMDKYIGIVNCKCILELLELMMFHNNFIRISFHRVSLVWCIVYLRRTRNQKNMTTISGTFSV